MHIYIYIRYQSSLELADYPKGDCMGWLDGGKVNGEDAKTKEEGDRVEAIWGGSKGNKPGDGHGHLVSNDGVNAAYLREPGGEVVVNNSEDTGSGGQSSGSKS